MYYAYVYTHAYLCGKLNRKEVSSGLSVMHDLTV